MRDYYGERISAFKELLGGKCVRCGSTEDLQFDHPNPSEKKFAITKNWSYAIEIVIAEVMKCQLLCWPCHINKTLDENGRAQHGTLSMYRYHRCRCEPCKNAWNTKCREWKFKYRNKNKAVASSAKGLS